MTKERMIIPRSEYDRRIAAIQKTLNEENIDLLVTHACECESANVRYLTNFWAVFDFVGVLVPREGKPILLTGGPESYDFAVEFAQIDDVRVHPMYVETSAPEWDKPTNPWYYPAILDEIGQRFPVKRIGIANTNIIPYTIMEDIKKGAPDAEFVKADDLIMKHRWYKSEIEIALLREASKITENAIARTVDMIEPGVREWEIQAEWMSQISKLGAEGEGYHCWITSGPTTYQSLCQATDRIVARDSMVQLSLGAKYNGYCGNMCRAIVLGELPEKHTNMIKVALECTQDTIAKMGPGVPFADVYNDFQKKLAHYGFSGLNLYGPAHGTGLQECEGPWVDNRGSLILEPNMVFNIDVWIADDQYGVRFEDGVLIKGNGLEELSTWRREMIHK
ncbi:proline dipeptidase [Clostridia bacterium]|nr:proline dipeptidase [Clostridia bacterium]